MQCEHEEWTAGQSVEQLDDDDDVCPLLQHETAKPFILSQDRKTTKLVVGRSAIYWSLND